MNLGRNAELRHQVLEAVYIGEARQVAQRQRLFGKERARNKGEGSVLRARNRDGAREAIPAFDYEFVHGLTP